MVRAMTESPPPLNCLRLPTRKVVAFREEREVIPSAQQDDDDRGGGGGDDDDFNAANEESEVDSDLWYSDAELKGFRLEAKRLCVDMRLSPEYPFRLNGLANVVTAAQDDDTRGLEVRACTERKRRRFVCNRYVVLAASRLLGGSSRRHHRRDEGNDGENGGNDRTAATCAAAATEELARLAGQATRWATELAAEEGARDRVRAYRHNFGDTLVSPQQQQQQQPQEAAAVSASPAYERRQRLGALHWPSETAASQATRRVRRRIASQGDQQHHEKCRRSPRVVIRKARA